jgi:hypothetical protein
VDCERARALLLEADLPELLGESDSELARHLGACPACRRTADRIGQAERSLAAWLARAAPISDASRALAAAAATARRRAAWRRTLVAGGTAAAAALAGLLLLARRGGPPNARLPTPPAAAAGFSVVAPPGRDVVVLHTANPRIVVVWYLPSRRSS